MVGTVDEYKSWKQIQPPNGQPLFYSRPFSRRCNAISYFPAVAISILSGSLLCLTPDLRQLLFDFFFFNALFFVCLLKYWHDIFFVIYFTFPINLSLLLLLLLLYIYTAMSIIDYSLKKSFIYNYIIDVSKVRHFVGAGQ